MVPILSILCPKHPLLAVVPPFLDPALFLREPGCSFRTRAQGPLARVSMRRSRRRRTLFSNLLWLSSDARNSDSSSPSSILRDYKIHECRISRMVNKILSPTLRNIPFNLYSILTFVLNWIWLLTFYFLLNVNIYTVKF